MASIFSSISTVESKSLRYGPAALLVVGFILLTAIWAAIYYRLDDMLTGANRDHANSVAVGTQSMAQRIVEFQHQWDETARHLRTTAKNLTLSADSADRLSTALAGRGPDYFNVLYNPSGQQVATGYGSSATSAPLTAAEMAVLSSLTPSTSAFLPSAANQASGEVVRYASQIPFMNGTYYLVTYANTDALLTPGWLSSIAPSYRVVLRTTNGSALQSNVPRTGLSEQFNQSLYSKVARKLPATLEARADFEQPSGFRDVEVTIFAKDVFADAEHRAKATIHIAGWISLLLVATIVCASMMLRRIGKNQKTLLDLVSLDALTGLPNRRALNDQLESIFVSKQNASEVGLIFVDLDNFKPVNDTHGHKVGDLLLRAVAKRLRKAVSSTETICRLGGDEFAIITKARSHERMQQVADAAVRCFHEPFNLDGVQIHTAASVGLAYSKNCRNSSELLKNADMAMYDAKNAGKGKYREFSLEMSKKALEGENLALALKPALQEKQFYLVYQPKVSTFKGTVIGFEALCRWQHPELGPISPATFIPIAESHGFIHQLGAWVLGEVVRQVEEWHHQGHGWLTVAANVSAIQLLDPFFVEKVRKLFAGTDVPPSCLQIELTESVLASNVQHAKKVLSQLRKLGLKIAIDDFGTGYSSLNSLQQFDIDYLKVDQSFVREMGSDSGKKICLSIVSLAHSLGMTVIAEGVETQEQFSALYEMGCDELQGYLFSKPISSQIAPMFEPPSSGLWADIEATRAEISTVSAHMSLGSETRESALALIEMELERVDTDFATFT